MTLVARGAAIRTKNVMIGGAELRGTVAGRGGFRWGWRR